MFTVRFNIIGNQIQTAFYPPILVPVFNITLTSGDITTFNVTAADPQDRILSYLDDIQYRSLYSSCISVLNLDQDTGTVLVQGIKGSCVYTYLVSNKVVDPPSRGNVQINVLERYIPPTREETIIHQPPQENPTHETILVIVPNNNGVTSIN